MQVPGFGPAAEVLFAWCVLKSATLVQQKDPKPLTPRPSLLDWTDAKHRKAGQLAPLRQGPPIDEDVRPWGRAAGVGQWEKSR